MAPPIKIIRTNSSNPDFQLLVAALDLDLSIRDGAEHNFYDQFNKIAGLQQVIVAYEDEMAVGCGAIKEHSAEAMEVKRMWVPENKRGLGIASVILAALESWARESGYSKCILETGKRQPEAIGLSTKNGYRVIPNFGQYENVENSICFE